MKRTVKAGNEQLEYVLVRSERRSVLMKVLPGGEVRVWAPSYTHLRDIDQAVLLHMRELKEMAERLENALADNRLRHPVEEASNVCVEGRVYRLHRVSAAKVSMKLEGDTCTLSLPEPENEEKVRAALKEQLVKVALKRITERLSVFAPQIGVYYGRVTIRDQKSRWGSCSSKNNLNFNWKLIMAPPEALDYVVIHELCHLIEFNHSPRFWNLVGTYMPEYEYWKKWLKVHGSELGVGD